MSGRLPTTRRDDPPVEKASEIVVFIPNENNRPPIEIARELAASLGVGEPIFGVDALTGAVEVRLLYSEPTLREARDFLLRHRVTAYDITLQ
jgi:hypothetical protein